MSSAAESEEMMVRRKRPGVGQPSDEVGTIVTEPKFALSGFGGSGSRATLTHLMSVTLKTHARTHLAFLAFRSGLFFLAAGCVGVE